MRIIILALLTLTIAQVQTEDQTAKQADVLDSKAIHKLLMPYCWTVLSDVAIFMAHYKYKQSNLFIHSSIYVLLTGITLSSALPTFIRKGFNTKHVTHYVLGLAICCLLLLNILIGCVSMSFKLKLIEVIRNQGKSIYLMNRIHKYIGVLLFFLLKAQVLIMLMPEELQFWAVVAWEIIFAFAVVFRSINQRKGYIEVVVGKQPLMQISNLKQLPLQNKKYAIFRNYVYEISPLLFKHPGPQIMDLIKSSSLDKYLYGIQGSYLHSTARHSHSPKCLTILDKPIAQFRRASPYFMGFQSQTVRVQVIAIKEYSDNLIQIRLKKVEGYNFEFKGYQSTAQFGRFYSLSIDHRATRLYSVVNFLTRKNKQLLRKAYFDQSSIQIEQICENQLNQMHFVNKIEQSLGLAEDNQLPILIKKYKNSQVSSKLASKIGQIAELSTQNGQGLSFEMLQAGKIIIFVGGTGLFPFCDLIDLLFKHQLIKQGNMYAGQIIKANPILSLGNNLDSFTFEFFGSFHMKSNIPIITYHQITFLNQKCSQFKFIVRLSVSDDISPHIPQTHDRFENILSNIISNSITFSKIFICGPPSLATTSYKILCNSLQQSKYQIL